MTGRIVRAALLPGLVLAAAGVCLAQALPAGYAEPGSCAPCHRTAAESYARTGMGRSFSAVTPATRIPPVAGGTFEHEPSGQLFSLSMRAGKTYLKRYQRGFDGGITNVLEASLDYRFGSGDHAVSYLHRTASGELAELPLTWYAEDGGHWGMSPAYDRPDHPGFARKAGYRCLFCHNAYPALAPGAEEAESSTRFPAQLPEGIDCQRCHGPGLPHINAARRGQSREAVRNAIVNPARLQPDRQQEICLQCHLETTSLTFPWALTRYERGVFSYRPGEPLENYMLHFDFAPGTARDGRIELVSAPYRLRQSACFRGSQGALTCTTCHDPHGAPRYAQACLDCHAAGVAKLVSQQRHPSSPDCVSCHIAKRRAEDAIHIRVTDHYIRKRPEPEPAGPVVERHDGNTPPYRGAVVPYYPAAPRGSDSGLYEAVAQVKERSNLAAGLPRLEAAIAGIASPRGEFYFALGEAYRATGRLPEAIAAYQQACARTPVWRHFYALGSALAGAGDLDRAAEALDRAKSLAPREIVVLETLAATVSRQGKSEAALAFLRSALALDPDSADARNNLGAILLQLDRAAEAEPVLRESVRLRPELAAGRLNLADLLARRGSFPEAKFHFEAALRIDPAFAGAHAAYAAALLAQGDLSLAREHFEQALRLDPGLSEVRNNLGSILLQMGDLAGAVREYRAVLAAHPGSAASHYNLALALIRQGRGGEAEENLLGAIASDSEFFEAHLQLAQLLLARQRADLAAPHLRKAAESPDPAVRRTAQALLR